jgi:hypothetical protein
MNRISFDLLFFFKGEYQAEFQVKASIFILDVFQNNILEEDVLGRNNSPSFPT